MLGVKDIDKDSGGCNRFNVFNKDFFLWYVDVKTKKYFRRGNDTASCGGFTCTFCIFYVETLTKRGKKYIIISSKSGSRGHRKMREESPGSIEQGCRLTAGGGDSKDSATENKRRIFGKCGNVR